MTDSGKYQDITGDALNAQRFHMLEDIAGELAGEITFPTCFDAALRLRSVLQGNEHSLDEITRAVSIEPLVSARILQLANSAAFNTTGTNVKDLKTAISRLGTNAVRSAALSIVINQLLRAKGMSAYADLTRKLWEHSIGTAAAARVITKALTHLNPEEAMLAGMVHDLGAFYMLYRSTQYEELQERPETVHYLILQWHESIGVALLGALGMPEEIIDAVAEHDQPRPLPSPPKTFRDIIYTANMLAGGHFEWLMQRQPDDNQIDLAAIKACYKNLQAEIDVQCDEMQICFS
jgi:HD-like signal output (HDOD) protein